MKITHEYQVCGVGFYTQDITDEQMRKFIKEYGHGILKIKDQELAAAAADLLSERAESEEFTDDLLDDIQEMPSSATFAEFICGVINGVLDGIELSYGGVDEYGSEAVYLAPQLPWNYSLVEKKLSSFEDLQAELKPFADIFEKPVDVIELEFYN